MLRRIRGRAVLCCDLCRARMDLGPERKLETGMLRLPTGWAALENGKHQCSTHEVVTIRGDD